MTPQKKLNILFVTPFVPYPLFRGASQRFFYFIKGVAERHNLTLFSLAPEQAAPVDEVMSYRSVFESFCEQVHFNQVKLKDWKPFYRNVFCSVPDSIDHMRIALIRKQLASLLQEKRFDLIHCEDLSTASYMLDLNVHTPVVVDRTRVDLEFQAANKQMAQGFKKRIRYFEALMKLKRYEKKILDRFQYQVVCSDDDYNFLDQTFGISDNVCIVRNGIDETHFCEMEKTETASGPVLSFTGAMDYLPNVDAMRWFFKDMYAPLHKAFPDLKIYIAGINPAEEVKKHGELPGVEVTGMVPDIRPYYANCDVYIAPIRIGGGTRLKIVEAMAMNRPVVSTTIGCQGLDLVSGEHIIKADTSETFIAGISRLLQDRACANRVAETGKDFVLDHFTWPKLCDQLDAFYNRVVRVTSRPVSAA